MIKSGSKISFKIIRWGNKIGLCYLLLLLGCAIFVNWLPLSFLPNESDPEHLYQPPFQWFLKEPGKPLHWLGTDGFGRDVLANIIGGARTALLVSVPAMVVATMLGVFLGSIAGYYGDKGYKQTFATIISVILVFVVLIFYFFWVPGNFLVYNLSISLMEWRILVFLAAILVYKLLVWSLGKISFLQKTNYIPLDFFVLKTIELLQSVPRLLLGLCLASIALPPEVESLPVSLTLLVLIGISALTYWPAIARLVRAEILKIKELPFIETTKVLGFSDFRIITKHALPNALTPVIVAVAFGIGNLMVLESTFSFINGASASEASWGRTIYGIKDNLEAWWLVFFPGLALCFTVLSLQAVAQMLIKQISPK